MTKLIVGLGNPGLLYKKTRHNIGFNVIDMLASDLVFKKKFNGLFSILNDVFFLKPQTMMNLSGESVLACMYFYKIDISDILVIHDDIDLALGCIKIKQGGGSGGHKGVKNISELIGNNYWRIRLGVGRPSPNLSVSEFVLGEFNDRELLVQRRMLSVIKNQKSYLLKWDFQTLQSLIYQ